MNQIFSGLTRRELKIFDYLHKNGSATKSDLIAQLNVRLTTLNRAMDVLYDRKLIGESGVSGSSGGRKPTQFDVARNGIYVVGVDISRTYTEVVVTNLNNKVLAQYRFRMENDTTPQKCVDQVADAVKRLIAKLAMDKNQLLGIGVGTVGPMDRERGTLLHPKGFPNAEWENDIPLRKMLEQKTGLPCVIDNGANAAVLLEYYFGAGRGCACVAYIHCGVGLRCAVIRKGTILRTINDTEDAFAQMRVDINGGCLENYVSLEAIRRRYCMQGEQPVSYEGLFGLAARRDESACESFRYSAKILSMGILNLATLLNPDVVILSGPLLSGCDFYYSSCMEGFREYTASEKAMAFHKGGAFNENVVALGAGLMLVEQNLKHTGRKG